MGTSTPTVDRILVALKAKGNRNVNSPVDRILVALKATVTVTVTVKKVVDEPAKEMLNVAGLHFSQGGGPYVRGSGVLHCVVDP